MNNLSQELLDQIKEAYNFSDDEMRHIVQLCMEYIQADPSQKVAWFAQVTSLKFGFVIGEIITKLRLVNKILTTQSTIPLDTRVQMVIKELNLEGDTANLFRELAWINSDPPATLQSLGWTGVAQKKAFEQYPQANLREVQKALAAVENWTI